MTMTIQLEHIQDNQHCSTTGGFGIPGVHFESIDSCLLSDVGGGKGPNFLQRWGQNMQKGGEYAMAAGAVGTVVPGLGETGIPEGVAAGGGAAWLLGKGTEAVGGLF
jgi:hypothetical protein